MIDAHAIRQRWEAVGAKLDERGRRLFAAIEVRTAGRGALAIVSKITGLARSTINRGEDAPHASAWRPFRHPAFTVIWTASLAANIGTWMYTAASSCSPDPLIVSLVQVAASPPIFVSVSVAAS